MQLELSRTLENNSFVSQEYYNRFNFKEAKESNNAAGIVKNAGEHFLCQSTIPQSHQPQGNKRIISAAGIIKNAREHSLCQLRILQSF